MLTYTSPRPSCRTRWNDRMVLTQSGVTTARSLNTNICPRCGCTNIQEGYCGCGEQDTKNLRYIAALEINPTNDGWKLLPTKRLTQFEDALERYILLGNELAQTAYEDDGTPAHSRLMDDLEAARQELFRAAGF